MGCDDRGDDDGQVPGDSQEGADTQEVFEISHEPLDGSDYKDYEWWDETSMFDTNPTKVWCPGLECYEAKHRCRIPANLETEEEIWEWIEQNEGLIVYLDPT